MADLSTEDNALTLAFLHSRAQNLQYTEIRRFPSPEGSFSNTRLEEYLDTRQTAVLSNG